MQLLLPVIHDSKKRDSECSCLPAQALDGQGQALLQPPCHGPECHRAPSKITQSINSSINQNGCTGKPCLCMLTVGDRPKLSGHHTAELALQLSGRAPDQVPERLPKAVSCCGPRPRSVPTQGFKATEAMSDTAMQAEP